MVLPHPLLGRNEAEDVSLMEASAAHVY
jgi:hypothetical protein